MGTWIGPLRFTSKTLLCYVSTSILIYWVKDHFFTLLYPFERSCYALTICSAPQSSLSSDGSPLVYKSGRKSPDIYLEYSVWYFCVSSWGLSEQTNDVTANFTRKGHASLIIQDDSRLLDEWVDPFKEPDVCLSTQTTNQGVWRRRARCRGNESGEFCEATDKKQTVHRQTAASEEAKRSTTKKEHET